MAWLMCWGEWTRPKMVLISFDGLLIFQVYVSFAIMTLRVTHSLLHLKHKLSDVILVADLSTKSTKYLCNCWQFCPENKSKKQIGGLEEKQVVRFVRRKDR